MKDQESLRQKIDEDEDFIFCPRLGNSLAKLIEKNPDGVTDERIQKVLLITEDELTLYYSNAIKKLRTILRVGD